VAEFLYQLSVYELFKKDRAMEIVNKNGTVICISRQNNPKTYLVFSVD
jgi:hypothetical protein